MADPLEQREVGSELPRNEAENTVEEPIQKDPIQVAQELLEDYPEIQVSRSRIGEIDVIRRVSETDYFFHSLFQLDPSRVFGISSRFMKGDDEIESTIIKLHAQQAGLVAELSRPPEAIDVRQAIGDVKAGLTIFDAFLNVPQAQRRRTFGFEVYDWTQLGEIDQDYRYWEPVLPLLDQPIIEIRTPEQPAS